MIAQARSGTRDARRRRLIRRTSPVVACAAVAFAAGAVVGARHTSSEQRAARSFVSDWERGDFAAMYALLTSEARRRISAPSFVSAYRDATAIATTTSVDAGKPSREHDGVVSVPMRVRTRIFGTLHAALALPVAHDGGAARIDWRPHLVFPGLRPGERLTRRTELAPRAALLARDGTPLAQGETRTSPLGPVAAEIAGRLGAPPPERIASLRARGFPPDAQVGISGLERVFDARLAGRPGGDLLAGARVLAHSAPRSGRTVRTTIDPGVERAAAAALAGRFGAVAVLHPRTGEVLALAGIAFSGPQPPGSTFKIITAAAALDAGIVKPGTAFPVQTFTRLEGVKIENANGEACGGTFAQAFAESCNSVFAPLGARLGARRLVRTAERFGFNEPAPFDGALPSTIPEADQIGDDLAVGSSAIGQGRVQATALGMATVAATIAERGRRPRPTLLLGHRGPHERAIGVRVARTVGRLMLGVVRFGTGTAAAIPGVKVAGKTGTAELEDTVSRERREREQGITSDQPPPGADTTGTDAWFAAYAPAGHPRVALSVMLVRAGAGGAVAAPAARGVLLAALKR